jgi:hypothetical protein
MEEEKIAQCIERLNAGLDFLIGNPTIEGDNGAIGRIESHLKEQNDRYGKLLKDHNRLKLSFFCLVSLLVGSGVVVPSVWYLI